MATTTGTTFPDQRNHEKQIGSQIGCMAGFLHIFDRTHLLNGKRIYSAKQLHSPPTIADCASEPGLSTRYLPEEKQAANFPRSDRPKIQLETSAPQMPVYKAKDSCTSKTASCKFREAPRLSLDSRATTDANGSLHRKQIRTINPSQSTGVDIEKQRKSTSVIARLMGLEPLTSAYTEPSYTHSPQLRRSASESRVTRDLNLTHTTLLSINRQQKQTQNASPLRKQELSARPAKCETMRSSYNKARQQRNYYDSDDFFPEPKQSSVYVYGEIEKRLKMSGIDGKSKNLDTLKDILEALQYKGLLHSSKSSVDQNLVYERLNEPPIVVMRPPSSYRSRQGLIPRRNFNSVSESLPLTSPHRRMRNSISPTHSESSLKSSGSSAQARKQYNAEVQRSRNVSPEPRRISSPVSSPKPSFRPSVNNQNSSSPRTRRSIVEAHPTEKILHTLSDDSLSINSDEQKKGKSLLSRCDMLLQSIADMNSSNLSEQPSPISVLDPSFYKEDESSSSTPSPDPKRSIDFKDLSVDFQDEDSSWTSSAFSTVDGSSSDDSDYIYIADVLRAIACLPEESNLFPLLEKQQCKGGKDGSKASRMKRKLIFDVITEILNKNKQLPPRKADLCTETTSLPYVWSEFKKIREQDESDQELLQVICSSLKKDLTADSFDTQIEVAELVLDIERMVFKDLISDAISDLASSAVLLYPRRKLAF